MKRFLLFLLIAVACAKTDAQIKKSDKLTDKKVNALLTKMTLQEKVGKMTQVALGVVSDQPDGTINPAGLKKALQEYHVGSILNVTGNAVSV